MFHYLKSTYTAVLMTGMYQNVMEEYNLTSCEALKAAWEDTAETTIASPVSFSWVQLCLWLVQ